MLTSYSGKAIMTKAKAMYSRHLTAEQYRELLQMKSVAEIAAYLKGETAYAEVLSAVQPAAVHRGQLESLLRKMRYEQYARLMRFAPSFTDSYYGRLMEEVEIEQILDMLRLLNAGRPEEFIVGYPVFLEYGTSFSLAELSKARTFDDMLRVLEKTPYEAALRSCWNPGGGSPEFTACETALLSAYYKRLEQMIDRQFRGRVRGELQELMRTRVELINILRIYRVKKYFPGEFETMGTAGMRRILLPSWKRIGASELEQLLAAPSAAAFLKQLEKSRYARYFGEGNDDAPFIEYRADCIRYRLARRCLHFASDAPTAFTAYMTLSELELDNIVTIIEGARYAVAPEETSALLVLS